MNHKSGSFGIKAVDTAKGEVTAIFARLNVRDLDGDVTLPGAFEEGAPVRVSAYNHASWGGALPVGKGTIHTEGDLALANLKFFMNTDHGRNTFETVKGMEELGEWSYGFDTVEASMGQLDGQDVQFLKKLKVHEVSPVLLGAGIGTQTLSVKSRADRTDEELLADIVEDVKSLTDRGLSLPDAVKHLVRQEDAELAVALLQDGQLRLIAAVNGIDIQKEM